MKIQALAVMLHEKHGAAERKVMVAKVDGAAEKALASRFSVNKFPSFFLVEGWTVREYDGVRSLDALRDFATTSYEKVEVRHIALEYYCCLVVIIVRMECSQLPPESNDHP